MNERELLNLYDYNRIALGKALRDAGGDSEMILSNSRELMVTLALNNIRIEARCETPMLAEAA